MSQIRKNVRLLEHCETLRAVKLHIEQTDSYRILSRYFVCLIKYYIITGTFYHAGEIDIEKYRGQLHEVSQFSLFIDSDDEIMLEWLEKEGSRSFAKEVRFILTNSFSIGDKTCLKSFETVNKDCTLLTVNKNRKTANVQDILSNNEKLQKLLTLLDRIESKDLDDLLQKLEEKTNVIPEKKEIQKEEPKAEAVPDEYEDDRLEKTKKALSGINMLL